MNWSLTSGREFQIKTVKNYHSCSDIPICQNCNQEGGWSLSIEVTPSDIMAMNQSNNGWKMY